MLDRLRMGRIARFLVGAACLLASRCWGQEQVAADLYGDPLPPRALCRLGTQRFRGGDETLAFSPDGRTIVSGGKNLRLFDAVTGAVIRVFRNPDTRCRQIAYSLDGKLIGLVGSRRLPFEERSRGCLRLLEAATGAEYDTLLWNEAREANFLHLLPDNATAITGSADGMLCLWDLPTKTARLAHKLPGPQIGAMAVSADGELVAAD